MNARDLAVVKTKRLFLKRNIPLVCRRLVAEQVELVEATSKVEAAGRAKSCTVMEPEEADRRLKAEEAGVLARWVQWAIRHVKQFHVLAFGSGILRARAFVVLFLIRVAFALANSPLLLECCECSRLLIVSSRYLLIFALSGMSR